MELTTSQRDRTAGVLLATAAGDALGAPYEFGPPLAPSVPVAMTGGGSFGWEPGEWTDDTSMAVAIAELTAAGRSLLEVGTQDALVARWAGWARSAKDVGNQTRAVLSVDSPSAATVGAAARSLHERTGHTGGNGSLMRTAPVALAYLDDPEALVEAASTISALTHVDPDAGEACVLWCLAIRHAVLTGGLDVRVGLSALAPDRAAVWRERIEVAERSVPADFAHNGWVVEAFQAAWCAIHTTPGLVPGLEAAVRGGRDTDTVAAIAGGLLGAAHGASAVPAAWRRMLHGWPGLRARDLVQLGVRTVGAGWGAPDYAGYASPEVVPHPYDDGVLLGGVAALAALPPSVDAVVSLCRVDPVMVPSTVAESNRLEVWLVDRPQPAENENLEFVVADTVEAVRALRAEGRIVFLHCVQAQVRTPLIAAAYGAAVRGVPLDTALADVASVLPSASLGRVAPLAARLSASETINRGR
ncbi:ADP-ribosylglycohydrolase family protein [Jatrophihabitans sp. YIM 134969]